MRDQNVRMLNPTHRYENVSGPTGDIDLLWSKELDGVFGIDVWKRSVYVGTNDCQIIALEAKNGSENWNLKTKSMVGGPKPTVSNGIVYTCAGDISERENGGMIYAVDADVGTVEWRSEVREPVNMKPIVANGTVYVGSAHGMLYALDTDSGISKWDSPLHGFEISSDLSHRSH